MQGISILSQILVFLGGGKFCFLNGIVSGLLGVASQTSVLGCWEGAAAGRRRCRDTPALLAFCGPTWRAAALLRVGSCVAGLVLHDTLTHTHIRGQG